MAASSAAVVGFIKHNMSSKFVHPKSGGYDSPNDDRLVIYTGAFGEERIKFKFYTIQGEGRYGYIEHVPSTRIVHPETGLDPPSNRTELVLHIGRHVGALFMYDYEKQTFVHRSGLLWHPYSGEDYPGDGTNVVLHSGEHEGARFHMVDSNGDKIDPYPTPNLYGEWKLVLAVENPKAETEHTRSYTVGMSKTKTTRTQHSWSVTAGVALDWFSASATYSGLVEKTESSTWQKSTTVTDKVVIKPGPTVAHWQWVFGAEQFGDHLGFSSTIFKQTNSTEKPTEGPFQ